MQSLAWISKWKARHTFKIEITLVLLLKASLLYGIWYFCFSNPLQDQLNDRSMTAHFLSSEQHSQPHQ